MANTNEIWQHLKASIIAGTARLNRALPPTDGSLASLLSRLPGDDPEGVLLGAIAVTAGYRRAGRRPDATASPGWQLCGEDHVRECGVAVSNRLIRMLAGEQREVLIELLTAIGGSGRNVPVQTVPQLLEAGRQHADLRPALKTIIGRRGHWLAQQNPDWHYLAGDVDLSHWQTGTRALRVAILQSLRETDPAAALDLIASTWKSDDAGDRSAFVQALEVGLSNADEPFLEGVLDDKSKVVRRHAAELLARLPTSELVRRMKVRLERLVAFSRERSGKLRIDVMLPEACDDAMVRDGIERKPGTDVSNGSKKGERAGWLLQMLSVVPPQDWTERSGTGVKELLAAAAAGDWGDLFLQAWLKAAISHKAVDWLKALFEHLSQTTNLPLSHSLLNALPAAEKEEYLGRQLVEGKMGATDFWLLESFSECWSADFSRLVVEWIVATTDTISPQAIHSWRWMLKSIARHIEPSVAVNTLTIFSQFVTLHPESGSIFDDMLETLQFRCEMLSEVNQ